MASDPDGGVPITDRALVEEAVRVLLAGLSPGWRQLHAEFEPFGQPPVAVAEVIDEDQQRRPVVIDRRVLDAIVEHHRRSAATGTGWQRLIIDCDSAGRLAVSAMPAPKPRRDLRWLQAGLATITVTTAIGAAAVFATAWRWGPPPRLAMIDLPPPPPRQAEAFDVMQQWFDGLNHGDATQLRQLSCADPAPAIPKEIEAVSERGGYGVIIFPEAISAFNEDGPRINVKIVVRLRPLTDSQRRLVDEVQTHGGFFSNHYTLVDEAGRLKVCDCDDPPN